MPIPGSPSVSISGDGLTIGMIVSEGMKSYPQSKWSDRSNTFRRAIAQEQNALPAMDIPGQRRIARATRNLSGPDNSDVQITVRKTGQRESVEVTSGNEVKRFSINLQSGNSSQLEQVIREIVRSIGEVTRQTELKNRMADSGTQRRKRV